MVRRKTLIILRNTFVTLSILCLFVALAFLVKFVAEGIEKKETIQSPVEVSHHVLFLSSYNPLYFTHDAQVKGLQESLYSSGIEYDVIYMDSNERGKADFQILRNFIKARFDNNKQYEAILLGDDAALRFAIQYHDELFPRVPMVFFGISDYELAVKAATYPNITGFFEDDYLEDTLNLAVKFFPERKTLVALHDDSNSGKNDISTFWKFRRKFSNYSFIDLNTSLYSQNDLIYLIESLPADSILFYMNCYSDKQGNVYSILSRTATVINAARVPIFRNFLGGEGMGILGGVHMDMEEQCRQVGKTVASIVRGKEISAFPLVENSTSHTIIDYMLMKSYNINPSLLPPDTIFYNKPESFLSQYGKILPSAIMLFVTLGMMLIAARVNRRIARDFINELRASRDKIAEREELLRYQAEYDEILDIYNRRTLTDWLREKMTKEDTYSVLIVDIDDFKMLNDNYGHTLADSILQYLVAMIKGTGEELGWKIARFGGDEFLIVIPNENITSDCDIVKNLLELIRSPIPLGDETLAVTASIGASCSDGITEPEQHIMNAEGAMYEAKNRGKNGIVIYDDEMKKKAIEEIHIKEKLQRAFDNDGFFMLYQPQIDTQTKKVSGYEALVRMKEPGIYPGQFIPVAERSGWIWRIGRITTELVIKQLAEWRDAGKELHPVSVNFSGNQLNDHGYVDFVEELLKKYDIPPHYLEIEITEGLFLEKSALADDIFKRFKNLGIRLLMDDFGTGYSSLAYLTYIPVDVIKLDKSLVDAYLVDGKDSFIKNIIHLMHDLDKDMIIEGVEEEWQYDRLREFGADTIQGYYFSKPIPADEAIVFQAK